MADRLFYAVIEFNLTSGSTETAQYTVGAGNTLTIERIQQANDGTFDILDIFDTAGNRYTNANADNPISGNAFPDVDADNNNPADLARPIVIEGNVSFGFTIKDTSAGVNVVQIFLVGYLEN